MFSQSRVANYAWRRARGAAAYSQRLGNNHITDQQLFNAVNQHLIDTRPRPFKIFLQVIGVMLGTIAGYSAYEVFYKEEKTFLPFYLSKSKRPPNETDRIDEKLVKLTAEEQLLERLSMNEYIQREFRLPVTVSEAKDFAIWLEEKDPSIKGLEISPRKPHFARVEKPIKMPKMTSVLEPIGAEDSFEIPVINQNKRDYDIWFTGTADLTGKGGNRGEVHFKGIFDFEHVKQAQVKHVTLVTKVNGKNVKEKLW